MNALLTTNTNIMSEETPIFKFKKKETKKVGDFDVLDTSEWTLLVRPQIQDVTQFVHFHKLWNVVEVPGVEADPDNGIEAVKEVKAHPAWEHRIGFIKDGKFIVTNQKVISEQTYHAIHKRYINSLQNYLDEGYKKDWDNYKLDEPQVPHYYINERTSQEDAMKQQMSHILRGNGHTASNPIVPASVAVTSVPTPKKKTGMFKILPKLINASTVQEVQPSKNP